MFDEEVCHGTHLACKPVKHLGDCLQASELGLLKRLFSLIL